MEDFKKKVVITGASGGLGLELALECRRLGHQVFGCGRRRLSVAEFDYQQVDVADPQQTLNWALSLEPPDLLINNAALVNKNAPLWEVPVEEFQALLKVNLGGIHNVVRAFLPRMLEVGRGVVVNLSSGWGRTTSPEVAPYCMTKWGVEGLTRALAQELPSGMAAVAVNPGIIDTPMLQSCFGPSASSYPGPKDWARVAAPFFLALGANANGSSLTAPQP